MRATGRYDAPAAAGFSACPRRTGAAAARGQFTASAAFRAPRRAMTAGRARVSSPSGGEAMPRGKLMTPAGLAETPGALRPASASAEAFPARLGLAEAAATGRCRPALAERALAMLAFAE